MRPVPFAAWRAVQLQRGVKFGCPAAATLPYRSLFVELQTQPKPPDGERVGARLRCMRSAPPRACAAIPKSQIAVPSMTIETRPFPRSPSSISTSGPRRQRGAGRLWPTRLPVAASCARARNRGALKGMRCQYSHFSGPHRAAEARTQRGRAAAGRRPPSGAESIPRSPPAPPGRSGRFRVATRQLCNRAAQQRIAVQAMRRTTAPLQRLALVLVLAAVAPLLCAALAPEAGQASMGLRQGFWHYGIREEEGSPSV